MYNITINNCLDKSNIAQNPSFRAIKMTKQAKRIVQDNTKSSKDWIKLYNLIESQKNNPVTIAIDHNINKNNKSVIKAKIGTYDLYDEYGLISKTAESKNTESIFFNPVRFINKLCKIANKCEKSLKDFNEILKDVPEPKTCGE